MKMIYRIGFWVTVAGVLLALIWGITGCHTVKSSVVSTSSVVAKDVADTSVKVVKVDSEYRSHIERDSAVGVGGGDVNVVLPSYAEATAGETPMDLDTTIRVGNVTLHSYYDRKGRQHIDCKADSLTLVVARLIQDSMARDRADDSIYVAEQKDSVMRKDSLVSVKVVGESFWERFKSSIMILVSGMVVGVAIGWVVRWKVVG